jgi:co-chaperonin GroES (HSP10)
MIRATTTRYIIKALDKKKVTAGGIYLERTDETQLAQIVSVGPQVKDPLPVNAIIVVNWQECPAIKDTDGTQYYVVDYRAVQAVVEDYEYAD